jgi:hypothetical protein
VKQHNSPKRKISKPTKTGGTTQICTNNIIDKQIMVYFYLRISERSIIELTFEAYICITGFLKYRKEIYMKSI